MIPDIKKTGDVPAKVNILIYGQPGTGKTRFAASAAPRFKVLYGDAEGGLLSLKKVERELSSKLGAKFQFDTWPIKSMEDMVKMKDYLYNAEHDYNVVCLDSGTELQQVIRDAILAAKAKANSKTADEIIQKDWGVLLNKMVGVIRAFRDLPTVSFVMTALSEEKTDELTGEVRIVPALDGKIKQTIDGYFDEVFYSFALEVPLEDGNKRVDYLLATRNNGKVRGKDRSGMLNGVERPNFCVIFDKIHGLKPEKKDEQPKSNSVRGGQAADKQPAKGDAQPSGSGDQEVGAQGLEASGQGDNRKP